MGMIHRTFQWPIVPTPIKLLKGYKQVAMQWHLYWPSIVRTG